MATDRRGPGLRGGVVPRLFVLGGAALWGTTGTTQAFAPAQATSASIGAARLVLGAVALVLVAAVMRGLADVRAYAAAGRRGATVAAMAAMAAYQVTFFAGVARTGVAVGTIVALGSAPVFAGVLGFALQGERPERRWALATLLAVVGCALLVAGGREAEVEPLGIWLALAAGASYATFAVASKVLLDTGLRPAGTMAVTFGGGAILLLPVLVGGDASWVLEPRGLAAAAWLGIATVGLAYLLFATGLRALPAATATTLTLAEPLTAGVLGVLLLAERPGPPAAAGVVLVAAGLVLLALRRPGAGGALPEPPTTR